MRKLKYAVVLTAIVGLGSCKDKAKEESSATTVQKDTIALVNDAKEQKVDVLVNGELFTAYLYTDTLPVLKKPTLYPLIAANGAVITRGYPLEPRAGERTDHPHHIGAWLNYGDVNGYDFWNNSDAIDGDRANHMGTIRNTKIVGMKNGEHTAELEVAAKWQKPDGETLLDEMTQFDFEVQNDERIIDRTMTLTALDQKVEFTDNKEGMVAIRVSRQLEHPSDKPVTLSDAEGKETDVPVLDNTGVSGHYLGSNGMEGDAVWGTRAEWVALYGTVDGKDVTVVIMDNPKNVGFPTYWHARGYGLFAANPLGQSIFSDGKEVLDFTLDAGQSVTFRYRIAIFDGKVDKARIQNSYDNFIR